MHCTVQERERCIAAFEREWAAGRFQGWQSKEQQTGGTMHGALKQHAGHLDLSPYNTAAELQALGLDRLKSALQALGLKCGGYEISCTLTSCLW